MYAKNCWIFCKNVAKATSKSPSTETSPDKEKKVGWSRQETTEIDDELEVLELDDHRNHDSQKSPDKNEGSTLFIHNSPEIAPSGQVVPLEFRMDVVSSFVKLGSRDSVQL